MTVALRQQGENVGHNRVARVMQENGLPGRTRRRYRVKTTDSRHDEPIAPNRLAAMAAPSKPDEVWTTDITYIETAEGWLYLAGVLDLYSRRLIGWAMHSSLETALPLAGINHRPNAALASAPRKTLSILGFLGEKMKGFYMA